MKNQFQVLILLVCFVNACMSNDESAKAILIEFLDSVRDLQNNPERFYGFLNIDRDKDMLARISGLKDEARDDFILYPLFFNHMKYVIKSKTIVEGVFKFDVEIKNVDFHSGMEKILNKFTELKIDPENMKNLLKDERKSLFSIVINDVVSSLNESDYASATHTFSLIKSDSGEYKIDLLGDVSDMYERNRLFDELFLKLAPGIFQDFLDIYGKSTLSEKMDKY
ncbi:hypothetical protein [Candidatus Borreliella tachyglossi]|uniref:hypothetical protein n=1 Tax=Candidatus Borreliella tachyglossi TaxID=1964448 RepID=UPI001901ECD6|nr:hypothetical protein [Candidatus Borreliella tachyglossi]